MSKNPAGSIGPIDRRNENALTLLDFCDAFLRDPAGAEAALYGFGGA
ncbi:MAG: hypothetical protein R2862_07185 [Thermoanaerobaculia bacterium]